MYKDISNAKFIISFARSSWFAKRWHCCLPESSGGRIRIFPWRYHSTMVLYTHASCGRWPTSLLMTAVQRLILIHHHANVRIINCVWSCNKSSVYSRANCSISLNDNSITLRITVTVSTMYASNTAILFCTGKGCVISAIIKMIYC
jgi:hypothetical protein